METNTQINKLEMTKKFDEKLKLFLFDIRPKAFPVVPEEKMMGIIDYRADEAVEKLKRTVPLIPGFAGFHTGDFILIEDILKEVADYTPVQRTELIIKEEPIREINDIEKFKNCLLLAAEKFVGDDRDREVLKVIISKIK